MRITVTAVTAGGGVFAVLQACVASAGTIFPAALDAALAVTLSTSMIEIYRRLGQGAEPPACHAHPAPLDGIAEGRGRPRREPR